MKTLTPPNETSFKPLVAALLMALSCSAAFAADSLEKDLSDANKEGRIWTSFALNRQLNAFELSVDVDGETALLTGTVEAPIDRALAEQVALNVSGVKTVENRITVDPKWMRAARKPDERNLAEMTEDATLTATIKSKLMWNEGTNGLDVNVDTLNRRVSLAGTVDSDAARSLAARLAAGTSGVRSVDNQLKVGKASVPRPTETALDDAWITTKVSSSFALSKYVDALDIGVDTKDGVVTLTGTVSSASEKDLAIELADGVRGTRRVDARQLVVVK